MEEFDKESETSFQEGRVRESGGKTWEGDMKSLEALCVICDECTRLCKESFAKLGS